MSLRKSKLDLLVRVRYSNPLPPPPCPPKLLEIPTNPMRYARPEFLNAIANDTPLPMIVDAECGMPLDLGRWECLWDEDADDSALNPDPDNLPPLDPKDRLLLGDSSASSAPYTNGVTPISSSASSTPLPVHVPWLRKTEYLSREGVQRSPSMQEISKHLPLHIDVSRPAQLRDIEASFAACNDPPQFSLSTLRHPNKPGVTAVESYEVFPDVDIWANAYDLFRFSERPGERSMEDPRLDCAILRPMESDGDHFLAYYLTKDDEAALSFKANRQEGALPEPDEESKATAFHFVRDYETVKIEQEVPNEFLLVIDDGDTRPSASSSGEERGKGAYYKNIERKMTLKKKRTNNQETYVDRWQVVHISHVPMSKEELDEREDLLAEVVDPGYLLNRIDADADGEIDTEAVGHEVTTGSAGQTDAYGGIMADIF
ncbi:RNA polymerase II-associated [Phlebopus sp. FC_14]|nr:RNA polymerase II-associated [Phlebopus sp. FC_14]